MACFSIFLLQKRRLLCETTQNDRNGSFGEKQEVRVFWWPSLPTILQLSVILTEIKAKVIGSTRRSHLFFVSLRLQAIMFALGCKTVNYYQFFMTVVNL